MAAVFHARLIWERRELREWALLTMSTRPAAGVVPARRRAAAGPDRSKTEACAEDEAAHRKILYVRALVILEVQISVAQREVGPRRVVAETGEGFPGEGQIAGSDVEVVRHEEAAVWNLKSTGDAGDGVPITNIGGQRAAAGERDRVIGQEDRRIEIVIGYDVDSEKSGPGYHVKMTPGALCQSISSGQGPYRCAHACPGVRLQPDGNTDPSPRPGGDRGQASGAGAHADVHVHDVGKQ